MADLEIQLEGSIKFSTLDAEGDPDPLTLAEYGDEISSLVIKRTRLAVTKPPTFANAQQIMRAGAKEDSLTINFFGDETVASKFWTLVWTATETSPCELYFEATWKTGSVSADNPKFSGIALITDLDIGGTVNEYKQQSKTWPARALLREIA